MFLTRHAASWRAIWKGREVGGLTCPTTLFAPFCTTTRGCEVPHFFNAVISAEPFCFAGSGWKPGNLSSILQAVAGLYRALD